MNFRRIFKERNYDVKGRVLPFGDFRFASDMGGFTVAKEQIPSIIKHGEELLDKKYPVITATEYMRYKKDGNRSEFEKVYFERRRDLLCLALAEHVEKKGRVTDRAADRLWMILEETTWVIPAHNPAKDGVPCNLPYAYTGTVDYIDLFSGSTGADLSFVLFLIGDELSAVSSFLTERASFELHRRIVEPVLHPEFLKTMWWTGIGGHKVNNWNPWIVSNVLITTALTCKNTEERESVVRNMLPLLDNFTATYRDDGGCEEGPSYWGAAGACLFEAACVLYDMTGGYIDIFDDELLRRMGEYEINVFVTGNRFLNFGDSPSRLGVPCGLMYDWGQRCHSEMMTSFARNYLQNKLISSVPENFHPIRSFREISYSPMETVPFSLPQKVWLDGVVLAAVRECNATDKGLYVAIKGGDNDVSHNHNDLGNVIVFADGKPVFIDAGAGAYTARTFSNRRYDIWSMRSDFHNVATIGGYLQPAGANAYTENHVYDEKAGSLSMELAHAYPTQAGIVSYVRSACLKDGEVILRDTLRMKEPASVEFHFLTTEAPKMLSGHSFSLAGRTVTFDPSLVMRVEDTDGTQPETRNIAPNWDTDILRRITLSSKEPVKEKDYVLTVK